MTWLAQHGPGRVFAAGGARVQGWEEPQYPQLTGGVTVGS